MSQQNIGVDGPLRIWLDLSCAVRLLCLWEMKAHHVQCVVEAGCSWEAWRLQAEAAQVPFTMQSDF